MIKKTKNLFSNEFFQGGVFLTITSFAANLLNYFFNVLAGRSLGPAGYSEITALFSYTIIASAPIGVISTIIIQKISASGENRFATAKIFEEFFWSKIKKWWFIFLIFLLATPFMPRITNLSRLTAYVLLPMIIVSFFGSFYGAALQGLRLFFLFSATTFATVFLKLAGAVLVTFGIDGLSTIILFLILSTAFTWITGYLFVKGNLIKKTISAKKIERRLISLLTNRQVVITAVSFLALTLFSNIDIVFVKKFFSAYQAGIYSSWSLFAKIILYLISPFISVGFIFFASSETAKHHRKTLIISLILLFFAGISGFLIYQFLAKELINLFFGSKFQGINPYLGSAAVFGSLYTVVTLMNNYFLAKKSAAALTLTFLMPFYIFFLFFVKRELSSIIKLNIFFSILAAAVYIIAFLKTSIKSLN